MLFFPILFSDYLDDECEILAVNVLATKGEPYSSVVSSVPTVLRPGFESQALNQCFFQFVLLKLFLELEKDEKRQKDARIGPYVF